VNFAFELWQILGKKLGRFNTDTKLYFFIKQPNFLVLLQIKLHEILLNLGKKLAHFNINTKFNFFVKQSHFLV
jgi:hypothetical protein